MIQRFNNSTIQLFRISPKDLEHQRRATPDESRPTYTSKAESLESTFFDAVRFFMLSPLQGFLSCLSCIIGRCPMLLIQGLRPYPLVISYSKNHHSSVIQLFNYSIIQLFNYSVIQLFSYSVIQLFNNSFIQTTNEIS